MKIWFRRNGRSDCTEVEIDIDTELKDVEASVLGFTHNTGNAYSAQLLLEFLNREFNATIKAIREEAYNQGWKDRAAKVKKKTKFGVHFKPDGYVGY